MKLLEQRYEISEGENPLLKSMKKLITQEKEIENIEMKVDVRK